MAKGDPEMLLTAVIDHGDGTATCLGWSALHPDLVHQLTDALGTPEFSNLAAATYDEETGAPIIEATMGDDSPPE